MAAGSPAVARLADRRSLGEGCQTPPTPRSAARHGVPAAPATGVREPWTAARPSARPRLSAEPQSRGPAAPPWAWTSCCCSVAIFCASGASANTSASSSRRSAMSAGGPVRSGALGVVDRLDRGLLLLGQVDAAEHRDASATDRRVRPPRARGASPPCWAFDNENAARPSTPVITTLNVNRFMLRLLCAGF